MAITRRGLAGGAAALAGLASIGVDRARGAEAPRSGGTLDAIVLGAGVAGLQAAWLLEQQGLKVTVLEGRQRVGGRVLTLRDQPGYPEMGFNSMGLGYGRGIDAAKRAGVELVDVLPRQMKGFRQELVLGGRALTREDWAKSPANPFPDAHKALMPWEIVGKILSAGNPLKDWSGWLEPQNAPLDISMRDFLARHGLSDPAISLAFDTSPYYGTSAYDVSALMFEFNDGWGKAQSAIGQGSLAVKGGNQYLPEGMARLLKGEILLGKAVIGVASGAEGVEVVCADGSSFRAKRAICALPFSTVRAIKFDPGLTGGQAKAVKTLPYQPLSIAFLTVKAPFWETDKLSPGMWTDGPLGSVLAQHFGAAEDEVTGLMVQARGELARRWDRMGREAALAMIVHELETIRPAAKGLVRGAALHSWGMEPFNAGDWAYFAPGQISEFVKDMAAPAGRVHFCGEHTAVANRGLEGALESAERAALEVLTA